MSEPTLPTQAYLWMPHTEGSGKKWHRRIEPSVLHVARMAVLALITGVDRQIEQIVSRQDNAPRMTSESRAYYEGTLAGLKRRREAILSVARNLRPRQYHTMDLAALSLMASDMANGIGPLATAGDADFTLPMDQEADECHYVPYSPSGPSGSPKASPPTPESEAGGISPKGESRRSSKGSRRSSRGSPDTTED